MMKVHWEFGHKCMHKPYSEFSKNCEPKGRVMCAYKTAQHGNILQAKTLDIVKANLQFFTMFWLFCGFINMIATVVGVVAFISDVVTLFSHG